MAVAWYVVPAAVLALAPLAVLVSGLDLSVEQLAMEFVSFAPVLGMGWAIAGVIYLGFARSLPAGIRLWLFAGCLALGLVSLWQVWYWFVVPIPFPVPGT